jgi:hypothetical protein
MNFSYDRAAAIEGLESLALDVQKAIVRLEAVTKHILGSMGSASFKVAFANSVPFLMVMAGGDAVVNISEEAFGG